MSKTEKQHTFGNSKAAIRLYDLLSEDINKNHIRYISRTLNKFNHYLKELRKVDEETKGGVSQILYANFKNCVDKSNSLPSELKSYTLNLINYSFKIWVKEQNLRAPLKFRNKK